MIVEQHSSPTPTSPAATNPAAVTFPTQEERKEADTRSVYVGNVDYGATAEELETPPVVHLSDSRREKRSRHQICVRWKRGLRGHCRGTGNPPRSPPFRLKKREKKQTPDLCTLETWTTGPLP